MSMKIFICSFEHSKNNEQFLMRFLLVIQLQTFTMWVSNTCTQGCAEENGFKREEEEFMAFFFKMLNAGLHSKRVCSPEEIWTLFTSDLQSPFPLLNW